MLNKLYDYPAYSAKLIVLFTMSKALDVIPACFNSSLPISRILDTGMVVVKL